MLSSYNEACITLIGVDGDGKLGIDVNSSLLSGKEGLWGVVEIELGIKKVPVDASDSEETEGADDDREERVKRLGDTGDTVEGIEGTEGIDGRSELSDETDRETVKGTVSSDSVTVDKRVLGSRLDKGVNLGLDSSGKLGIVLIRDGGRLLETMLNCSS